LNFNSYLFYMWWFSFRWWRIRSSSYNFM